MQSTETSMGEKKSLVLQKDEFEYRDKKYQLLDFGYWNLPGA